MNVRKIRWPVLQPANTRSLAIHIDKRDLASGRSEIPGQTESDCRLARAALWVQDDYPVQTCRALEFYHGDTPEQTEIPYLLCCMSLLSAIGKSPHKQHMETAYCWAIGWKRQGSTVFVNVRFGSKAAPEAYYSPAAAFGQEQTFASAAEVSEGSELLVLVRWRRHPLGLRGFSPSRESD